MKQLEKFFSIETEYDKKHRLNTCKKKVPQEYLTQIENGCSIEQLEEMMRKKFDVFKYGTQITIHGIFPELSTRCIGGYYVNLIQNKNKSVGVRYTAIDYEKKTRLFNALTPITNWSVTQNSSCYLIHKMERLPNGCEENREKILEIVHKYEAEAKKIDRSLFVGKVSCYIAEYLFRYYIVLDLDICCFYEKNFRKLFENLSGMTWEEGQKKYEEYQSEKKRKDEEFEARWKKEAEERKAKEAENKKKQEAAINQFVLENPVPEGYTKRESYKPQAGDNVCRLYFDKYEKKFMWVELTCKKYFGKVKEKPIEKGFDGYWCKPIITGWVYVKTD